MLVTHFLTLLDKNHLDNCIFTNLQHIIQAIVTLFMDPIVQYKIKQKIV